MRRTSGGPLDRFRARPPVERAFIVGIGLGLVLLLALLLRGILLGPPILETRVPETRADADPEPLPASHLAVPIRVDLAPLVEALESAVPMRWGSLEERHELPDNDRAEVAFELERGPFSASFEGSTAVLTATVRYRVRAWYDAPVIPAVSTSCGTGEGEERPRLTVTLRAPLGVDAGWRLEAETTVGEIVPATDEDRDRCRVTILRLDMTDRVVSGARDALTAHTEDIDRALASVDVRSRFEAWWTELAEPVELTDDLWLVMAPEALQRGAIVGEGDRIEVPVILTARPRIVMGSRPDVTVPPLPPLQVGDVRPGLRIVAEGRAEYAAASRRLTEELGGRVFGGGGRSVRIGSVSVSGIGGGRLAFAVDVTGDARGVLWLVGTPAYDPRTGDVSVPDLDFDVATADVVLDGASWLARAGFVTLIREQARWPATPAVEWVARQLERGLNQRLSDDVALEGRAGTVTVLSVRATREALLVRAAADAEATLVVKNQGSQ